MLKRQRLANQCNILCKIWPLRDLNYQPSSNEARVSTTQDQDKFILSHKFAVNSLIGL